MKFSRKKEWSKSEEILEKASRGEICPRCLSENIKQVGSNPDLLQMNMAYDCQDCGEPWEGY